MCLRNKVLSLTISRPVSGVILHITISKSVTSNLCCVSVGLFSLKFP